MVQSAVVSAMKARNVLIRSNNELQANNNNTIQRQLNAILTRRANANAMADIDEANADGAAQLNGLGVNGLI